MSSYRHATAALSLGKEPLVHIYRGLNSDPSAVQLYRLRSPYSIYLFWYFFKGWNISWRAFEPGGHIEIHLHESRINISHPWTVSCMEEIACMFQSCRPATPLCRRSCLSTRRRKRAKHFVWWHDLLCSGVPLVQSYRSLLIFLLNVCNCSNSLIAVLALRTSSFDYVLAHNVVAIPELDFLMTFM